MPNWKTFPTLVEMYSAFFIPKNTIYASKMTNLNIHLRQTKTHLMTELEFTTGLMHCVVRHLGFFASVRSSEEKALCHCLALQSVIMALVYIWQLSHTHFYFAMKARKSHRDDSHPSSV